MLWPVFALLLSPAVAADDSLAGMTVLPLVKDLALMDATRQKQVATWLAGPAVVIQEKDDWLEVRYQAYPGPSRGWVRKARVARPEAAIRFYTERLGTNKIYDVWVLQNRAAALNLLGKPAEGIKDLAAGLKLDPQNADLLIDRGNLFFNTSNYDNAINDYDAALQLDAKNVVALVRRGDAYKEQDKFEKAQQDYDKAILITQDYPWAYRARGGLWALRGEKARGAGDTDRARTAHMNAVRDFSEAIQIDNKIGDFYTDRGLSRQVLGEYAKAAEDFQQAIDLSDTDVVAINQLAWLLATCPDPAVRNGDKAVERATRACELTDWNLNSLDTLAAAYAEKGEFLQAVKYQKRILDANALDRRAEEQHWIRLSRYQQKQPHRDPSPMD